MKITNLSIKKNICLLLFLFINVLFYFKYVSKVDFSASIVFIILYCGMFFFLLMRYSNGKLFSNRVLNISLIAVYLCMHTMLFRYIPIETIAVDRWSVITSFLDALFNGDYPYFATSFGGNYPGPMPFYFVLALPFYFIGELGFFSITGLLLLILFLYKNEKNLMFTFLLYLMLSSGAIFWEIYVRSTVLVNATLILMLLYYIKDIDKMNKTQFWITALLGGILLSTRSVFALVFVVWGVFVLKNKLISFFRLFKWGLLFVLGFAITFVPLILMFSQEFFEMNPFIIQSSFLLPTYLLPLLFIIAIIGGLLCKEKEDIFYCCSLVLFAAIFIYFLYHTIINGIKDAYLNSVVDISYFIFAIPFLLFAISYKEVNKISKK